jgi:sulfite exporter TauE/SafE
MSATGFVAVFLVGLLGGVHCIGMCGGIVSALTVQLPGDRKANWPLHLAYNVGRISSYSLAGAVMGGVGSLGLLLNNLLPVQMTLYIAANLMLLALGAYLTGATRALAFTERIGQRLWLSLQPATRRFLPVRRISQAFPLGMLWGWLPCGMVYSVLAMALMSGSAQRGAATMLVFGIGTLPNLMFAGLLLKRLRGIAQARWVRVGAGVIVFGFGVFGLIYAPTLGGNLWNGIVCKV